MERGASASASRRTGTVRASAATNVRSAGSSSRSSTTSTSASASHLASRGVAGRRRQDGRGVGEARLHLRDVRAVQSRQGAQAIAILARAREGRDPIEPIRIDPARPQRDQGTREGQRDRRAGQPVVEPEPVRPVQQPRGQQRRVPAVPGREAAAEQRRLRDGARQLAHLETVHPRQRAARTTPAAAGARARPRTRARAGSPAARGIIVRRRSGYPDGSREETRDGVDGREAGVCLVGRGRIRRGGAARAEDGDARPAIRSERLPPVLLRPRLPPAVDVACHARRAGPAGHRGRPHAGAPRGGAADARARAQERRRPQLDVSRRGQGSLRRSCRPTCRARSPRTSCATRSRAACPPGRWWRTRSWTRPA